LTDFFTISGDWPTMKNGSAPNRLQIQKFSSKQTFQLL
jgi:hypothetical protein